MLSEIEYSTLNTVIDAIHNGTTHQLLDSDCYSIVALVDEGGSRSSLEQCYFIIIHADLVRNLNHTIEISGTSVFLRDCKNISDNSTRIVKYNTTLFENNTDEEFFQNSTIQDFSIIDEKFVRRLIELSIIVRKNIRHIKC